MLWLFFMKKYSMGNLCDDQLKSLSVLFVGDIFEIYWFLWKKFISFNFIFNAMKLFNHKEQATKFNLIKYKKCLIGKWDKIIKNLKTKNRSE